MNRSVRITFWVTAAAACVAHVAVYGGRLMDDAFITFTYSKHIAQGVGPVFSLDQRVEATSSMLWAALLVPFEALGLGSLVGSKIVGLECFILSMFIGARLTAVTVSNTDRMPDSKAGIYSAALIALSSPLALWSFYGMENGMVAVLLLLSTYGFLCEARDRRGFASAVPIALLEASRPEGFVFVGVFVLARIIAYRFGQQQRQWLLGWLGLLLLPVLCYEVWGFAYYGHWLPNTVAAKVSGSALLRVVAGRIYVLSPEGRLWSYGLLAATAILAIKMWQLRTNVTSALRTLGPWLLVTTLCFAQFGMAVVSGGDWMPNVRFLSHVTPLVAIAMVLGAMQLSPFVERWPRPASQAVAVAAILVFGYFNVLATRNALFYVRRLEVAETRALTGMALYLNERATAHDTVACSDIGRVGYYFKGKVLDWWGLADEVIAQSGQALGHLDVASVLSRHPRYIVLYSTKSTLDDSSLGRGQAVFSKPFWESPEFRREYRAILSLYFWTDRYHVLFERVG